jgi:hypothetical protein
MQGFVEGFRKSFNLPRKNSRLLFRGLHNNHNHCLCNQIFFFAPLTIRCPYYIISRVSTNGSGIFLHTQSG